jgi:diaminohydroxyphosphoribosylaminopyrimidine deaminase / 5-amino-6-(5-phosphoribosylamino)uracil reductase
LTDARFMAAAIALSQRSRALSAPNPNVGCLLVNAGRVVGRGWTQKQGRPHAEAMALAQAGSAARGATAYVTLEPCAHDSRRGPACSNSLIDAGVERVVVALIDPDPRTNGAGSARLAAAGIVVETGMGGDTARAAMAGWLMQQSHHRPFITLKLATSLDGCIARADGQSRWITGEAARAHGHLERARSNMVLVGRGTYDADAPRLDVRLAGLEDRLPVRGLLSRGAAAVDGWRVVGLADIFEMPDVHYLMVEGGAQTAASFLAAGLVDRLMLYRAPIVVGAGKACVADIGLENLDAAHGIWRRTDTRTLGSDTLDVYDRILS